MIANAQFKAYVTRGRSMNSYDEEILGNEKSVVNKK